MKKKAAFILIFCLTLFVLTGCSNKPVVKIDLTELANGKVYGAIEPGSSYEDIEAANIPLIDEPISEMNWEAHGKKSYTYAADMEKIAVSVNGTTMQETTFQILGEELINVTFTPKKNTLSESLKKAFEGAFGAPEERPTAFDDTVTLVWVIEANGHTSQLGLVQQTISGKQYCNSIQISFLDLITPSE